MMHIKELESERLVIRPFTPNDLQSVHQILDIELKDSDFGTSGSLSLKERERWLQWSILNYEPLARLKQPPYGERAIEDKTTKNFVGICGFVPCLDCFEQLSDLDQIKIPHHPSLATTEFGLFYAIAKEHQKCGFATEAASAMANYAFQQLHVKRIVATTTYNNEASLSVMRKLGMQIRKNPFPTLEWLQIVGFLNNPYMAERDDY